MVSKEEIISEVGEDEFERFDKWMTGQTVGVNKDKTINYYRWDYERWKERKTRRWIL